MIFQLEAPLGTCYGADLKNYFLFSLEKKSSRKRRMKLTFSGFSSKKKKKKKYLSRYLPSSASLSIYKVVR